ncbi:von Willebrand factor A domain-containing protein 8 [Balamuthia mandrillaris]
MLQKERLGQDMLLLGPPSEGAMRRRLALRFCELTHRAAELVSLSRDTTEADLKQRREIRGRTVMLVDQSAVRAAIEGRVLILEGLEKAERNILPLLNNLLENREMALEDGRFLMNAERYDKLRATRSEEEMKALNVVRVHPNFRVIALAVPVPRFMGNPLDPPLRSRFQVFNVGPLSLDSRLSLLSEQYPNVPTDTIRRLVTFVELCQHVGKDKEFEDLVAQLPPFPEEAFLSITATLDKFPSKTISIPDLIARAYPFYLCNPNPDHNKYQRKIVSKALLKAFGSDTSSSTLLLSHHSDVQSKPDEKEGEWRKQVQLRYGGGANETVSVDVRAGPHPPASLPHFVPSSASSAVLANMLVDHAVDKDICIIGEKGSGKSTIARQFARMLGYETECMMLYKDMSTQDLLQRRATAYTQDEEGSSNNRTPSSCWEPSPLIRAAIHGRVAILDNIDRLPISTLSVLQNLICERQATLIDGRRLVPNEVFEELQKETSLTAEELNQRGIFAVHPSFRIVATGNFPSSSHPYVTPELLSMFRFHQMPPLLSSSAFNSSSSPLTRRIEEVSNKEREEQLLSYILQREQKEELSSEAMQALRSVIKFALLLRSSSSSSSSALGVDFPLRTWLRCCRKVIHHPGEASDILKSACLYRFLPPLSKRIFDDLLSKAGLSSSLSPSSRSSSTIWREQKKEDDSYHHLVPEVLFHNIPSHERLLEAMYRDFVEEGENLLLIGPQGVGKNKLTDRFLEMLRLPRQYVQLHRDTTVASLTQQPSLQDGKIVWEDSPLVEAVRQGHVLVVDEADKAPPEVVCVFQSLVDGEMTLADGRHIVPSYMVDHRPDKKEGAEGKNVIVMHPNFRMIVLANKPGWPFLGNDFFAECGDLFSSHPIDNPDVDSELQLLRSYAPNVPLSTLTSLTKAFAELRLLVENGQLTYPYSTRECVNIAKHLEAFPNEGIEKALLNVFAFDCSPLWGDPETRRRIQEALVRAGLPPLYGAEDGEAYGVGGARGKERLELILDYDNSREAKAPKHGKHDPTNSPHVGGNTWAGGTGGADTAGLGGKGGPYRLDAGHPVHQISDEEKRRVSKETRDAAKAMAREALNQRLKDIDMTLDQASVYEDYLFSVKSQIGQLRVILESLQAKSKEREWLRRQSSGAELDEGALVEAIAGERGIYKRRGENTNVFFGPQKQPKKLRFVMDVSGSMYRFNSYDGRLDRMLATAVLLMESLHGYEQKFHYWMVGHSGDSPSIPFVYPTRIPQNRKERFQVIQRMAAHSQYCMSGDYTLEATKMAIEELSKEPGDEHFVITLSDANLERYGIAPARLGQILQSNPKVRANCIFIASLWDEAARISREIPPGLAHVCMDTKDLPATLQRILATTVLK